MQTLERGRVTGVFFLVLSNVTVVPVDVLDDGPDPTHGRDRSSVSSYPLFRDE